jgi:hypothetical protein
MASGLFGISACKPIKERRIYAVYFKADVAALKEQNARLLKRYRDVVHENTELSRDNDRLRWEMSQHGF